MSTRCFLTALLAAATSLAPLHAITFDFGKLQPGAITADTLTVDGTGLEANGLAVHEGAGLVVANRDGGSGSVKIPLTGPAGDFASVRISGEVAFPTDSGNFQIHLNDSAGRTVARLVCGAAGTNYTLRAVLEEGAEESVIGQAETSGGTAMADFEIVLDPAAGRITAAVNGAGVDVTQARFSPGNAAALEAVESATVNLNADVSEAVNATFFLSRISVETTPR